MYLKTFTRRALIGVATAATLALAACGGGQTDHGGEHSSDKPDASEKFNDADVMFAQMMIPHHEQAVEMAELAENRASDADVKDLAVEIKDAQGPEIKTMTKWLKSWDQPVEPDHDMGGEDGMADADEMMKLKDSKGTEFDKLFAELMIAHHEGAVTMAEDEQKNGENPEAKKLAKAIEKTQTAEIEELEAILDRL
ncbi:DUF305 domain-containing protein [Stackebrandtia nassauensis]|uniref:DUF305 domain-containing protein n=1 Tax=Stackebrandtia nassauensis (strain DSM 44728 / CIP 108903 / NRRL B-16338 / NBRC 102104 / LLR-40K-21) TaxID=446470 RepID=D3Q2A6_STANL|nr:DUF305 domain-containing protein [Stackebrandtia nassauensis]ADD43839.1 protein of unknown function DUF305 [Stackebrandtia nassauensis DSM 44728]